MQDSDICQGFRTVDAPLLDSLRIMNEDPEDYIFGGYREFAYWNVPNLRRVTLLHYFLLSLPGLANVTTLDMTLIINQINFADLLKDISKMNALEKTGQDAISD